MPTANRVGRVPSPELELLEPRATRKQKSPQVGVAIMLFRPGLRMLLSRQLGLLSLLEFFFVEIGLIIRAGH